MPFQSLIPIWNTDQTQYKSTQIGALIHRMNPQDSIESISCFDIAIMSVGKGIFHQSFRQRFYPLFSGNWTKKMIDLGEISICENENLTTDLVKNICNALIKNQVYPIVIAENQSIVLAMYQAFEHLEQLVNMVSVDALLDLGNSTEFIDPNSYMSKILSHSPSHLYRFTNIGYQSYYVSQEELDFMRKMIFDAHRLGDFFDNISKTEPLLRDADLINIDLCSVQAKDLDNPYGFVNGFSSREICQISRYAGISPQNKCIGVFGSANSFASQSLIAQIIWYIIEGFHFRVSEFPTDNHPDFVKYIVPINHYEIVFFKSLITNRWWIKPRHFDENKMIQMQIIPCHHSTYKEALNGVIPDIWWNAYRL